MRYYEIWFYYYGEDDERTNGQEEYTFYIKTEEKIVTKELLIEHLKTNFPNTNCEFKERMSYVPDRDFDHITKWFEIDGEEFERSCGVAK